MKTRLRYSILDIETIKVNGKIVSSKYSIIGAEHRFSITVNETSVNCMVRWA